MMEALTRHLRAVRRAAGVSTRVAAIAEGVHPTTWNRHVTRQRWARPYDGVAIADWADDHDRATLAAVAAAHGGAGAGETARWLHGGGRRPRQLEVIIPHARAVRRVRPAPGWSSAAAAVEADATEGDAASPIVRRAVRDADAEARRLLARCRKVRVRRCRWLTSADIVLVGGVPVLTPTATAVALAATAPDQVRGFLVDARFGGQLQLPEVRARLAEIPSLRGRHRLVDALDALEDRRPESVFHDQVLAEVERRGYRPYLTPIRLDTPHGRPVHPDIALPWQVALELEGDLYHRDREARRRDRDRLSSYASSGWSVLLVDHRTWTEDRERVFTDLDASILAQWRRGTGRDVPLPQHLRSLAGG